MTWNELADYIARMPDAERAKDALFYDPESASDDNPPALCFAAVADANYTAQGPCWEDEDEDEDEDEILIREGEHYLRA